ncbi:MAG: sulfite exporter TauE/SafE family protein, partial [Anaerolineae bacterium]|nr:sulfite exporter TauE/SafE family protein [Anaerolineae bacterium]
MLSPESTEFIIIVIIATMLIGLSKGGLGGPVPPMLTTPLLSQFMPVSNAVSLALPLLMIADVFALWAYWRQWDMRYIKLTLPAAALGVLVGMLLLSSLPNQLLRPILGVLTLIVVIYKLVSDRLKAVEYQPRPWHAYLAGGGAGLTSALANAGAPPWTAYMLLQGVSPKVFIATTTLFFASVNAIKLPFTIGLGLLKLDLLLSILWV